MQPRGGQQAGDGRAEDPGGVSGGGQQGVGLLETAPDGQVREDAAQRGRGDPLEMPLSADNGSSSAGC
jgi:hypothetical protein